MRITYRDEAPKWEYVATIFPDRSTGTIQAKHITNLRSDIQMITSINTATAIVLSVRFTYLANRYRNAPLRGIDAYELRATKPTKDLLRGKHSHSLQ